MTGPPDVRLAAVAAAAWIGTAIGTALSARIDAVVGIAAITVMAALLSHPRSRSAAPVFAGLAVGAVAAAVHVAAVREGPVARAAGHTGRVALELRLVRDPVALASGNGRRFVLADADLGRLDGHAVRAPVLVIAHDRRWLDLLPGQRLRADGRLEPARHGDDVAALVVARGPPEPLGRPPWWQRLAGRVRSAFRTACRSLPADERGLVPGLVIGDVSAMPPSLTADFRATGLTHLNAVSGANVAVVLAAVTLAGRALGLRRGPRVVLAGTALLGFVVLVRPSPSVLRAAVMGAVVLTGALLGRRAQPLPALAAAVLGLVVIDPFLARAPGFAMSVLATGAIVLAAPRLARRWSSRLPPPVASVLAVSVCAQLACTPVLVAEFGQLTPWAVPANMLAAPVVAPATVLGVICALVAPMAPSVAALLAWLASVPAAWLAVVARTLAHAPGSGLTWPRGARGVFFVALAAAVATLLLRAAARVRARAMLGRWLR